MTITIDKLNESGTVIGSVELDNDMVWTDELDWNPIISEIEDTIQAGRTKPLEIQRTNDIGRPVTLESLDGMGRQKKETVEALRALLSPEYKYYLTIAHNELTFESTVIFRNWESGGALSFRMYKQLDGLQTSSFYYDGVIRLEVCSAIV